MKPIVTFVIPTYNRIEELNCTLSSLICQSNSNWEAIVVIDNGYLVTISKILGTIDKFYCDKIKYIQCNKRYNDWGHTPREIGKQKTEGEYVIMTGDDNYYTPNLVEELEKVIVSKPGMVYWDMVHSHYDYQYFKCSAAMNQIDMGAFATRIDLAKQIKLSTSYAADGEFVEDFKRKFSNEKITKINKVLFVHN